MTFLALEAFFGNLLAAGSDHHAGTEGSKIFLKMDFFTRRFLHIDNSSSFLCCFYITSAAGISFLLWLFFLHLLALCRHGGLIHGHREAQLKVFEEHFSS